MGKARPTELLFEGAGHFTPRICQSSRPLTFTLGDGDAGGGADTRYAVYLLRAYFDPSLCKVVGLFVPVTRVQFIVQFLWASLLRLQYSTMCYATLGLGF